MFTSCLHGMVSDALCPGINYGSSLVGAIQRRSALNWTTRNVGTIGKSWEVPQVPSCPPRVGLVQGWESVCWGAVGIPQLETDSWFFGFLASMFHRFKNMLCLLIGIDPILWKCILISYCFFQQLWDESSWFVGVRLFQHIQKHMISVNYICARAYMTGPLSFKLSH